MFSISEAVDCNHQVIMWNLLEHWYWANIYKVPMTVNNMELSWIILDHISSFKNHINSAGVVTLNTFKKAYNHYLQGMKPLYSKQWGSCTTTDWVMLAEDLVRLLHSSCVISLLTPVQSYPPVEPDDAQGSKFFIPQQPQLKSLPEHDTRGHEGCSAPLQALL